MYRSHTCNELQKTAIDKEVTLSGWVHRRRDHGGMIFIDLRDGYGLTQIVFDPSNNKEAYDIGDKCRSEFVIKVKGKVRARPEGQTNEKLDTGEIEIIVDEATILNESKTPPFEVDQDKEINEEIRLKYRYIDLRRERLKNNITNRYKIIKEMRDFLDIEKFMEIETPFLIKGTPEGSREYIVPSRIFEGQFYVLPQSPQQLKQLLMISSFDKYFQFVRCFRDEDQRGDRQPEFTQLDMEMSFIEEKDILDLVERMMIHITKKFQPNKKMLFTPFKQMTWDEAMNKYGSDKPDLRFEMEIQDVSEVVKDSEFKVFSQTIADDGVVKALKVEGGSEFTRKEIDKLEELAKIYRAKGLAYIIFVKEDEVKSPIAKFLKPEEITAIKNHVGANEGDIVFFTADKFNTACESLGQVRLKVADMKGLRDPNVLAYAWVTDFPLFEWNEEAQQISAVHHPFTRPLAEDIHLLEDSPEKVRSQAYDLILNGEELAGGSLRIHEKELQSKIFDVLKISKEDAENRFGHMLHAFEYGAPPHGGIAFGLDRLIMIFQGEPNIREVMAFPKDQKARDLMLGAPSELPMEQIAEMHIKVKQGLS